MDIIGMSVVSVDDNHVNLLLLETYCKEMGLLPNSFLNPLEGLEFCKANRPDIILVDYMMPEMDGLEFISKYREVDKITPVVMITAAGDDEELQLKALKLGATDFLSKPINSSRFIARITNLLKLKKAQNILEDEALILQDKVNEATKNIIQREHETLLVLGKTAEYKDPETGAHIQRVAHYTKLLAALYGEDEKSQEIIFHASPFHDIGKVGIPDRVLLKPAKLDEAEFEVMKKHPQIGYEILKDVKSEFLRAGAIIALTHHEKYNGKGYPNSLFGEIIPLYGRITAIADVFDALTSKRPYKKAWSFEEAVAFLIEQKGEHFDPKLVDLFVTNIDKVKEIFSTYQEEEHHSFKDEELDYEVGR